MSIRQYTRLCEAEPGVHPNMQTLLRRFGTWENACRDAGLAASGKRHAGPFGAATFTEEKLVEAVGEYVRGEDAAGRRVTLRGYQEWAHARRAGGKTVPLSGAVRMRLIGAGRVCATWPKLVDLVRK